MFLATLPIKRQARQRFLGGRVGASMTDIEFIVSLNTLLCGLLLANVANNMADAFRARADLPIGFVPWAIAFYIVASVVLTFVFYSVIRDDYNLDIVNILGSLAVLLPYIFVSRLLYPEHKEKWSSVEHYYIANRNVILRTLVIPQIVVLAQLTYYQIAMGFDEGYFISLAASLPFIATFLLLMLTDRPLWHRIGFGFVVLYRLFIIGLYASYMA